MRLSLSVKTVILLAFVSLVYCLVFLVVGRTIVNNIFEKTFKNKANEIAASLAVEVDANDCKVIKEEVLGIFDKLSDDEIVTTDDWGSDEFYAYLERYDSISKLPEFNACMAKVKKIQSVNDVDCLYLAWFNEEKQKTVYLLDAAEEDACAPGTVDPFFDDTDVYIPGKGFSARIVDAGKYGLLVSAGTAVYDENGDMICLACVDVSMNEVKEKESTFIMMVVVVTLITALILTIISVVIMRAVIIKPINQLAKAAKEYCADNSMEMRNTFSALDIHTHDEIEDLAEAMKHMETDINDYIADFIVTNEMLNSALEQNNDNK